MSLPQARAALADPAWPVHCWNTRLRDTVARCPALHDVWSEFAAATGQPPLHCALPEHIRFFVEQWGNNDGSWPQPPPSPTALAAWATAMCGCDRRIALAKGWELSLASPNPRWVDRAPEAWIDPSAGRLHCSAFFQGLCPKGPYCRDAHSPSPFGRPPPCAHSMDRYKYLAEHVKGPHEVMLRLYDLVCPDCEEHKEWFLFPDAQLELWADLDPPPQRYCLHALCAHCLSVRGCSSAPAAQPEP